MKNNLLKIYEGFFDDLDQLNKNQDDEFGGINSQVYDEHNYILGPYKNPEFFEGLCNMCEHYQIPYNKNGFLQEDLNQITFIKPDNDWISFFQDIISLDELQYFQNLKIISSWAFDKCFSLEKVYLPKNLIKISDLSFEGSFAGCISLKEIIIPEKFKDSIEYIFYNVDLTKVNITYI